MRTTLAPESMPVIVKPHLNKEGRLEVGLYQGQFSAHLSADDAEALARDLVASADRVRRANVELQKQTVA